MQIPVLPVTNGGNGATYYGPRGAGGTGGRIAIYYDSSTFNEDDIKCKGGRGRGGGKDGTIVTNGEFLEI